MSGERKASYYHGAFRKLLDLGITKSYIREYLLEDIIYFSKVYVYMSGEAGPEGTYSTTGVSIHHGASKNQYCGELKSKGFPTLDEYAVLFEGNECVLIDVYTKHKDIWHTLLMKEKGIRY